MLLSVKEALEIDALNRNDLWYDAIMKQMKNVKAVFRLFDGATPDEMRKNLNCYLDVKRSSVISFLMLRWISPEKQDL